MKFVTRTALAGTLFAILASGCTTLKNTNDGAPTPTARARSAVDTRVFAGQCIVDEETEAIVETLVAAAIPRLIDMGFNAIGTALKAAGEDQVDQRPASVNLELSKGELPPCVQVVRGRFRGLDKCDDEIPAWVAANGGSASIDLFFNKESYKRMCRVGMATEDPPAMFFEGLLRPASDQSAIAIAPLFAWFNQPMETYTFRFTKARGIALALSFHKIGEASTSSAAPSARIDFGNFEIGQFQQYMPKVRFQKAVEMVTARSRFEGGLSSDATGFTRSPLMETKWFPLTFSDSGDPWTLTATLFETQKGSKFFKFLSDIFQAEKEALTQAVKEKIDPVTRAEQKLAAAEAAKTALNAYFTTFKSNINSLTTFCASEDNKKQATQILDAFLAQSELNTAAEAAGVSPLPFTGDTLLPPFEATEQNVNAACKRVEELARVKPNENGGDEDDDGVPPVSNTNSPFREVPRT